MKKFGIESPLTPGNSEQWRSEKYQRFLKVTRHILKWNFPITKQHDAPKNVEQRNMPSLISKTFSNSIFQTFAQFVKNKETVYVLFYVNINNLFNTCNHM